MTTYNQNKNEYCVGDYIGYTVESYNCSIGGYDYHTSYGCIVDYINKNDSIIIYTIIKQYGGELWTITNPKMKISEKEFLLNFSLYDQNIEKILKNKNNVPKKIMNIINLKYINQQQNIIKKVFGYSITNILKNKNEKFKISPETWYINWYACNIFKSCTHEEIIKNMSHCYGASKDITIFMKSHIDLFLEIQMLESLTDILFLIEENVLFFKYKSGKIDSKQLNKLLFNIIVQKLNTKLVLKYRPEQKMYLSFKYNGDYYKSNIDYNFFETKIIIPSKYRSVKTLNTNSICHKKLEFDYTNQNNWHDKKSDDEIFQQNIFENKKIIFENKNVQCFKNSKSYILKITNDSGEIIYLKNVSDIIFSKNYIYNNNEIINLDTL